MEHYAYSPVSLPHPPAVPAGDALPRLRAVTVVSTERQDDASRHTLWCVAHVDHVVVAQDRVRLIRTDAGLVVDVPAAAVVPYAAAMPNGARHS